MSAFNKYILIIALYFYCFSSPPIVLFLSAVCSTHSHIKFDFFPLWITCLWFDVFTALLTMHQTYSAYPQLPLCPTVYTVHINTLYTHAQCTRPYKYLQRYELNNINNILIKMRVKWLVWTESSRFYRISNIVKHCTPKCSSHIHNFLLCVRNVFGTWHHVRMHKCVERMNHEIHFHAFNKLLLALLFCFASANIGRTVLGLFFFSPFQLISLMKNLTRSSGSIIIFSFFFSSSSFSHSILVFRENRKQIFPGYLQKLFIASTTI